MRVEDAAFVRGAPRLFLAGAGGPFPDFSFATLLHGAVTNISRSRMFIEKLSRVRHTIKTSRKLAPGDCHVVENRLRLRLKVMRASSAKELDDLTLVRCDASIWNNNNSVIFIEFFFYSNHIHFFVINLFFLHFIYFYSFY